MCVLVVEDELLIRLILVEELIDAGFEVQQASNGEEALAMIVSLPVPLTVLVTDVHMPGKLNGVELAARVREQFPALPIIYTTGRPDALSALFPLGDKHSLVRKPYVPNDVITQVRALLAA